jgi:phosphonate transport system permease protein
MSKQKSYSPVEIKPSLTSPIVAGLISLIVPGLGHFLARYYQRGLLLLASFVTIIGLLAWRITVVARFDVELVAIAKKAFDLQPLTMALSILVIILYLWIAIDAYLKAHRPSRGLPGVFVLVILAFFGLGWQIGGIEPIQLITGAKDGGPLLMQVMWPWERAFSRPEELQMGHAQIQVPCSDAPPPIAVETDDAPFLLAEPNCGIATDEDGNPGSTLTLTGSHFTPGVEAAIWWEDPLGNPFRQRVSGQAVTITPDEDGQFQLQVVIPYRLIPPSAAEGPLMWQVQARQDVAVGALQFSTELGIAVSRMIETIFLGMMATFFGIILAIPISFMAAKNLMSATWVTLAIYFATRTILNIVRSIEPLIWAVIAIIVVGLGPFAGILALTIHSIAALSKLYSESIESIDPGPIEAIHATGANWLQTVMYAVVPQIIPPFVSFTIYRWDINVRMSTVIGLVGGGGIGFVLIQWIRLFDYKSAGIAVWFIAITVAILDFVSAEIRQRFV